MPRVRCQLGRICAGSGECRRGRSRRSMLAGSELVNGLLQRESPLRMAGSAEGSSRTGVDEDVILLGVQRCPLIEVGCGAGTAGTSSAARGAVADELDGGYGAVLLRADAEPLI